MSALLGRLLTAALVAGVVAGLAVSLVQHFTTTPLILAAEIHEAGAGASAHHGHGPDHGDAAAASEGAAGPWAPADGIERALYTVLANVVLGVGFALLLVAAFALSGRKAVDARYGAVWGAAGFAVFVLGPGLGLPPEVPGMAAAGDGLFARQVWWLLAVGCTAAGLGLLAFGRGPALALLGALALVLPHAIGAPHPPAEAGSSGGVPPELAGRFVAASFATAAAFWALLGASAGALYRRLV